MDYDKSRVYTALNADELKVGSTVLCANTITELKNYLKENVELHYRELKKILTENNAKRFRVQCPTFLNDFAFVYLISEPEETYYVHKNSDGFIFDTDYYQNYCFYGTREECQEWIDKHSPKFRPYKNCDEMIEDFKQRKHFEGFVYYVPMIWVKDENATSLITDFGVKGDNERVCLGAENYDMEELFNDFKYLDGSPVGAKE